MNKIVICAAGLFGLYSSVNAAVDAVDVPRYDFFAGRRLPDGITVLEGKEHFLRVIRETINNLQQRYSDNEFREKFPHDYFGGVSHLAETVYDLYRVAGWRGMEEVQAMDFAVGLKRAFYYADSFERAERDGTWGPGDREGSLAGLERAWEMIPAVIDYAQKLLDYASR
ncbi:MAG: hypothetical protein LBJ89_04670 [Holosporales bacterium]|nr:hypothetical protein [Holosporales bacterium]